MLGVTLDDLLTSDEEMEREFILAEHMIANAFREEAPALNAPRLPSMMWAVLNV
jgi:hypothetical protein